MEISDEANEEESDHLFLQPELISVDSIIHPWLQASYSQAGGALDWQD